MLLYKNRIIKAKAERTQHQSNNTENEIKMKQQWQQGNNKPLKHS